MAHTFNSPPGWPSPPAGWTPPQDWQPDPSWPPAPPGWNFWVEAPAAPAPAPAVPAPPPFGPPPPPGFVDATATSAAAEPQRRSAALIAAAVVGGVVVLGLAGFGVYSLLADDDPQPAAAPTTESPSDSGSDDPSSPVGESPAPAAQTSEPAEVETAPAPPDYGDPATWLLSLDGFGPLRIGMTAQEGIDTGGFEWIEYCDVGALAWTGQRTFDDENIALANLNEAGVVWRINIYAEPSPMDTGVDFSTPYEELVDIYGDRLVGDVRNTGIDGAYAVNGQENYLKFQVRDEIVDFANGISLSGGNVAPDTMPNVSSCKDQWRQ